MIYTVRQTPDRILRNLAKPVLPADFEAVWLRELVENMSLTLEACIEGVALAAPQIGESRRIFIVGRRAFPDRDAEKPWPGDLVFINPVIVRRSRRQIEVVEGCLSIANRYGTLKRRERVSVEAFDLLGRKFTRHASGLLAQIFQHEIEHLDGRLFIDQARDLHYVEPDRHHD